MSAARHIVLSEAEAKALASLLLKLTESPDVDEAPKPVVRERPRARPEDFELVRKIRRRKGIR